MIKKCVKCHEEKSIDDFNRATKSKDGRNYSCKSCSSAYHKLPRNKERRNIRNKEYSKSPERRAYLKDWHLKRSYGISLKDFNQKIIDQNGMCGICNKSHIDCREGFDMDHDHVSGKIRDLLCPECNLGLGMFKDNVDILSSAMKYLIKHADKISNVISISGGC